MNETSVTATIWPRLVLVLVGGCAALALWALSEFGPASVLTPAIYLALFAFLLTYSFVALSLVGPVAPARALPGAFTLGLPVAALTSLAGARHLRATDLLDDPEKVIEGLKKNGSSLYWPCHTNHGTWIFTHGL